MREVEEEPLFAERAAGIDIAKAGVEVTIRVPSEARAGARQQETRSFATTRRDLLSLADWLRSWGVTKVGMEATSDYGKPVYFRSEEHTSELQSHVNLVCRLLLEKKKKILYCILFSNKNIKTVIDQK